MSNEYKDWIEDLKNAPIDSEDHKRWLLMKYPWLNMDKDKDEAINYIDNTEEIYTFIDCAPKGWAKLCEDLCAELKVLFDSVGFKDYSLCQVKEKYGSLRWYEGSGVPIKIGDEYSKIIRKYEELSEKTCCICGAPAIYESTGWISPYCGYCAAHIGGDFIKLKTGEKIRIE